MTTTYQVGRAQSPEKDDPTFDDMSEALIEAAARNEDSPDTVLAVWQLSRPGIAPEVRCLMYQGELFEPAGIR